MEKYYSDWEQNGNVNFRYILTEEFCKTLHDKNNINHRQYNAIVSIIQDRYYEGDYKYVIDLSSKHYKLLVKIHNIIVDSGEIIDFDTLEGAKKFCDKILDKFQKLNVLQ